MKIVHLDQNSDQWLEFRRGKITGSKLKDLIVKRGNGKKIGFYQLVADKLGAIDEEGEDDRQRGHDLESEAVTKFEESLNVKTEQNGMWLSDESDDIAISPDRVVSKTEALEVKCPKSARHIQTVIENIVPAEYMDQIMQYFIVNKRLQQVHYVSYCPKVIQKPYWLITVNREQYEDQIEFIREYELQILKEVNDIVEQWTF
ncbi:MAG: YqaJ viral recombinase family protein [bacterium]